MADFPRTTVGGVSMPRLIIGTNWFRGFSHTTEAKDRFIKSYQTPKNVADIMTVFAEAGVDAVMGGDMNNLMTEATEEAEQRSGRRIIRILTPGFNSRDPSGAEGAIEAAKKAGATFCFPHQGVTDALIDRRDQVIRDIDVITRMIRKYEMIPGLSTHMPEAIIYADSRNADIESYVQPYNAAGFLMQVEVDWIMWVIRNAKKPVMTIKPLAAGRLTPVVGLAFVWSTIREQDMVTIGCTTPDEAREVLEISWDILSNRIPDYELQKTRSKKSLSVE